MTTKKKLYEKNIIEAFLFARNYPPSALLEWDRERPDALVRINGRVVGVEITKIVEAMPRQPIPPQKWTAEAENVVAAAQTHFEKRHRVALVVAIGFNHDWKPSKSTRLALAQELAGIVASRTTREFLAADVFTQPIELVNPHGTVSWMYIARTRQSLGGRWTPSFSGYGRYALLEDIEKTICRKEAELPAYKSVTEDVWLLIDCDLSGQGIFLEMPEPPPWPLMSSFSRVFMCGFGKCEWTELPVSKN